MTDKEIIIDGVNIYGCKRYSHWGGLCGYSECGGLCKDLPECDYKQLKRLEFENKLLKADYEASEQENARLKEEIKEVKKYQYQQEYLDKEIENHQKLIWTLAEGLNKRQMLLQEVKEYCEKCKNCVETGDEVILYTILQKISECIGVE